jgi:hypothetical protein
MKIGLLSPSPAVMTSIRQRKHFGSRPSGADTSGEQQQRGMAESLLTAKEERT